MPSKQMGRPLQQPGNPVGKRIRKFLRIRKMKQKELATRTHLAPATISTIIVGPTRNLRVLTALRMAKALGVSVEDLWGCANGRHRP